MLARLIVRAQDWGSKHNIQAPRDAVESFWDLAGHKPLQGLQTSRIS